MKVQSPADLRHAGQLALLRQVRASGFTVTGVLADAEFGDNGLFRAMLHRLRLAYAVGISSHLTVFRGTPRLIWQTTTTRRGRPRKHPELAAGIEALSVEAVAAAAPSRTWRRITWRNRRKGRPWT